MNGAPIAFGPYLVYEQIGVGGMAEVHRAELVGTDGFHRQVALKRMLPHVAGDLDMVKSFVREAHLASHLHHANVAQTYELGKVDDIYFIAMELITGRNLREILRQCAATTGQPMPVPVALNIINQICDALDYAHNLCDVHGKPLGIIHRDVSPSNIIVAEGGCVKLIDFGIAKVSAGGMQTMSGTIKGKFGYMAPEYLEGQIDARADLFAVGVIAHELLTNRPLFSTPDDMETLKRVRRMEVAPPSRQNPHVPGEVDDIVMTALSRDPDKRWQHATALRSAMTTITQRLGLQIGNPQAHAWIESAFLRPRTDSGNHARIDGHGPVEDPSIIISDGPSLSAQVTMIAEPAHASALPGEQVPSGYDTLPAGTPQRITSQPGGSTPEDDEYARAVARYARHDSLRPPAAPPSGRLSQNLISTLAGAGGPAPRLRNPPSASSPPANLPATSTTVPPPIADLRESDPAFAQTAGKAELPTTPLPVPPPPRSSLLVTVILVLVVAGIAGTAVYLLLPLVT